LTKLKTSKKPCKKCGTTIRYVSNGGCVECSKNLVKSEAAKKHRETYYEKNKEIIHEKNRKKYRENKRYVYAMVKRTEHRAMEKNLPFDLSVSDIVIPEFCPILNVKLEIARGGENRDNSPSIDKIDPKAGYVKGNIQIISMKANRIKTNATVSDIERVLEYLKGIYKE
jgi:hypothetical protein